MEITLSNLNNWYLNSPFIYIDKRLKYFKADIPQTRETEKNFHGRWAWTFLDFKTLIFDCTFFICLPQNHSICGRIWYFYLKTLIRASEHPYVSNIIFLDLNDVLFQILFRSCYWVISPYSTSTRVRSTYTARPNDSTNCLTNLFILKGKFTEPSNFISVCYVK